MSLVALLIISPYFFPKKAVKSTFTIFLKISSLRFFITFASVRGKRYSFRINPTCFKTARLKISKIISFNFSKSLSINTLSITSFTIKVNPDRLAASIRLPINENNSKTLYGLNF